MVFRFDAIGSILGLGYLMGPRSSMILCAGGHIVEFRAGADDLVHRHPARQYRLSVVDSNLEYVGRADFSRLRPVRRRGCDRRRGHIRDREIAPKRGWACAARHLWLQRAGGYRNCGAGCGSKLERIKNFVRHRGSAPRGLNTSHEAQKLRFAKNPFVRAVIQRMRLSARLNLYPHARLFAGTSF